EPMPPHPGLAAVLELPGGGEAFSGDACAPDAEACFVPPGRGGGRAAAPAGGGLDWRGPVQVYPKPVLQVPASLAVVELAAYTERGALGWAGGAEWDPTPWAAQLRSPAAGTLRRLREGLVARPVRPDGGWPALGGPNLDPFAQAVGIPSFLLPTQPGLFAIRQAAGGLGSEVVLVLGRRGRVLKGRNACALLYPLLVGLLLPAEETRAWTRYEAALIDVRSGGVLAVAQGEAEAAWASSPLLGDDAEGASALRSCEDRALERAVEELRLALANLEGQGRFRLRAASPEGAR
ncbi:MAG: hypothetical protein KDD82_10515, partial [Planctomycetes bacterium]|nr:hypothetical protein [Planctomycetota bacterium]